MAVAGSLTYDTSMDVNGFQKGLNKITGATKSAGSTVKSIVLGLGITKLISSAISSISNSIDSAVSRVDTLNNFPKVMSNLGIASEDAQESVNKLSDGLTGLPTTLDDAASSVQRFTSVNGDVNKSTDYFLAMNNAILAGGASAEVQSSAIEQLSQAYSKGKFDMQEWRSLQTAMPAQLKQVAESMGMTTDDLYQSIKDGTTSMDDFMGAIVNLNENGTGQYASFAEQAKSATGGIATAQTNLQTAITRGVANIMTSFDEILGENGLGSISGIINGIGSKISGLFKAMQDVFKGDNSGIIEWVNNLKSELEKYLPKLINTGVEILNNIMSAITETLPTFIPMLVDGLVSLINGLIAMLPSILQMLITLTVTLIQSLADQMPTLIPRLVQAIMEALMQLTSPSNLESILNAGMSLLQSLIDGILNALPILIDNLPTIIDNIIEFLSNNLPQLTAMGRKLTFQLGIGLIKAIPQLISKIPHIITSLVSGFGNYASKWLEIGKNVVKGIMSGITNGLSWIKNKLKDWVGNVTDFIKKIFKIGSPSKLMRDEVGQWIPKGIAVGIDANTDSALSALDEMKDEISSSMKEAVNYSTGNIKSDASITANYGMNNTIVVNAQFTGDIEMDAQKTGRILTPVITKTIKSGGGL
jgi:tape measure domain-containing protein